MMDDNDPRYQEHLARMAQIRELMETSIPVSIQGTDLLQKKPIDETSFQWVTGEEALSFYQEQGINLIVNLSEPNEPVFYFPSDRPDLAAYFKLKYGGVTVN